MRALARREFVTARASLEQFPVEYSGMAEDREVVVGSEKTLFGFEFPEDVESNKQ